MHGCLAGIAALFNQKNITWALGASMLLYYKGIAAKPNDIDLMLSLEDAQAADRLLCRMGTKRPPNPSAGYGTRFFYEYTVKGVEVDLMAGLVIRYPGGAYEYRLEPDALENVVVNGASVSLCPVEDWYLLYLLMPGREERAACIEAYLKNNRFNRERLHSRLLEDIPLPDKRRLEALLMC